MKMRAINAALLLVAVWIAQIARADIGGRSKLEADWYDAGADTLEAMFGERQNEQIHGQLRLKLDKRFDRFNFELAWQADVRHGTTVRKSLVLAQVFPVLAASSGPTRYLDLGSSIRRGNKTVATQDIDRLNLAWSGDKLVLRLGRQALTWGSGLVFHPMDLVSPFEPVATDTAFKPGADMAYGQWLFDDGSDLQVAGVFRRRHGSLDPEAGANTWAAFANIAGDTVQWSLLAARHRNSGVLGAGASRMLWGLVWNLALVTSHKDGGRQQLSALVNGSWAGVARGHNLTLFAEYYHHGYGEPGSGYTVSQLDPELLWRLDRGESFVTGRDYLALGASWNWTPLIQLEPTVIANLHDHSTLFDAQLTWSISDNITVKGGARFGFGPRGSELRGLQIAPGEARYLAAPSRVFVRIDAWF